MATKKRTTFRDRPVKMDDLDFDMAELDSLGKIGGAKKRKPITRIMSSVAKGSLGHFTSEAFIRHTLADALPKGYDTAIESGFKGKESVDELYHTAAKEWRKVRPEAQRLVKSMTPKGHKVLPRKMSERLRKFSEGNDYSNQKSPDPDEQTLRQVMGELEMTRATEHARERHKDEAKDHIREQVQVKQHRSSMRVMASMDARLARIQSFNDQVFSRYQRRSLEVQYRQYFTMRDMLKLQAKELTEQRSILGGILHNTGLPDTVKMTSSDFVKRSIKTRLTNHLEHSAVKFGDNVLNQIMGGLTGSIKGAGSNLGLGLSMANMSREQMASMKDMGMNPMDEFIKQASGAATGAVASWVLRQMMSDINPHGKTSQLGSKIGRRAGNIPDMLRKYASTPSNRRGMLGTMEQMLKDSLPRPDAKKRLGGSALLESGEPAFFRKKTRDSIETVMPGYLSRILRELTVMRTGNAKTPRLVWNAEKDSFTSRSSLHKSLNKHIADNSDTEFARQQVGEFADKLLAGKTVSAGAHHALTTQIFQDVLDNKGFEPQRYLRPGSLKHINGSHAKELRTALRGTYRGDNKARDEVRIHGLQDFYKNLQRTIPNVEDKLSALNELGYGEFLRKRGFIESDGGDIFANRSSLAKQMAGRAGTGKHTSTASKNDEINSYRGRYTHLEDVFSDNRRNLYKKSDLNNPVISSGKIFTGSYSSALSGRPIRTMAQVLEGVRENGTLIISAKDAAKLVTSDGTPLPKLVDEVEKNKGTGDGRIARGVRGVKSKLAKAGRAIDDRISGSVAPAVEERLGTPQRRRATTSKAKEDIEAAAKYVKDHPKEVVGEVHDAAVAATIMGGKRAKEAVGRAKHSRFLTRYRRLLKGNKYFKKAKNKYLDVKGFATHLYKDNVEKPIVTAQALRKGELLSQETGEPITHMEQVLEGVVNKNGDVIVSKEDAQKLRTSKGGETLAATVGKANEAVGRVKGGVSQAKAKVKGAPGVLSGLWHKVTGGASAESKTAFAAANGEVSPEVQGLRDIMEAFKEGNFVRLEEIIAAIDGAGGGAPGEPGSRRRGLLRRGLGGAWGALKGTAKTYGKYVKGVFKGEWNALKWAGNKATSLTGGLFKKRKHLGKEPADVYVKGEKDPRLTKGDMEAGAYFNKKEDGSVGSPITCPADIKGPVVDKEGGTILSKEDFDKGITDNQGRSLLGSTIKLSGWVLGKAANFLGGYYSLLFKGAGMVARGAFNLAKGILHASLGKKPIDVYVHGDTPWKPRLLAIGMRAGSYYCLDSKKVVRCPDDIKGDVVDIKDHNNIRLSKEDIAKGLEMWNHKPLKLKNGVVGKLLGSAAGLAGTIGSGYMNLLGHMTKAGFALASSPFRLVSKIFGGRGGKLKMKPGQYLPTSDQMTHSLLEEVLHLLDDRLPKNKKLRRGSWKAEFAKRKAAKEEEEAENASQSRSGRRGGLMGLLGSLFHRDRDEDDEDDDDDGGGNNYYDMGDDRDGRHRRRRRGRARRRLWKRKGMRGLRKVGKLTKLDKLGRFVGRSRLGRMGGRALSAIGRTRGLGMLARGGGRLAGGLLRGGMAAGRLALGLGGAAELGGIASGVGTAVAGAGTAIAGAASAVGTGLAAVGSAIASVISLPVILGVAAVAAVGAAVYYGYKYYSLKKSAPLRKLRMAQYGVDMNEDVWPAGTVQKLEALVMPYVKVTNGKAKIDGKGFAKKTDDMLKLFDLKKSWYNPLGWFHDTDQQDLYNQDQFYQWLGNRFRPVFCTWMGAMRNIAPGVDLSDADDKLKDKQKRSLVKAVMAIDPKIYALSASPWEDQELSGGKVVEAAKAEVLKGLKPEKKGKGKGKEDGKGASAAAGSVAAAAKGAKGKGKGKGTKGGVAADGASAGSIAAAMKNTTGKGVGAKIGITASGAMKGGSRFLPSKLSATMAVRYKTYGLKSMETDRVRAVFLLENDVFGRLVYDNKGNATFSADAGYFFDTYAGYFGVSPSDEENKLKWFSWFAKRFMPTLLQYATAVKHANKSTDPRDADTFLSPAHLLEVANITKAAVYKNKDSTTPVWTFTDSPYGDGVELNSDVDSVKSNIKALEEKVKEQKLAQEQAKKSGSGKDTGKGGKTKENITNASNQKNANDIKKQINKKPKRTLLKGLDRGSIAAQRYMKTGSTAAPNIGTPVKQPGHGTAGDINDIPMPAGSGLEGTRATIAAAAKMTGMDPQVLETFAGIESAWRPNAQAKTSSAAGLFQFIHSTWESMLDKYGSKYGINPATPPTDARAASLMMGEFTKQNLKYLQRHLGHKPTDTDLYLAHFLGAGGATNLLSAPSNEAASQVSPKAAKSNHSIFYKRGGMPRTVEGVVKLMDKKVAHYRDEVLALPPMSTALAANTDQHTTTTTANGPKGGKGGLAAAAARSILAGNPSKSSASASSVNATASIVPPSHMKRSHAMSLAMVNGGNSSDPVMSQRHASQLKARIADEQARVTQEVQNGHSADMVSLMRHQAKIQEAMLRALSNIDGHTGDLSKKGIQVAGLGTGTVPDPGAPNTPPGSKIPTKEVTPLPPTAVSVKRAQYG